MQLTIDSSEPLERVLQVVGSLYGVELAAATETSSETPSQQTAPTAPTTSNRRSRTRKSADSRPAGTKSRPAKAKDDSAAVRSWARLNGHDVRDRGRIPAALIAAYKQSARDAK